MAERPRVSGAREVAQLVGGLPNMPGDVSLMPSTAYMVYTSWTCVCIPVASGIKRWRQEDRKFVVRLHRAFRASLGYVKPCSKEHTKL